jgi:hypothetical protein
VVICVDSRSFLFIHNLFALYILISLCYTYSSIKDVSMEKDYQHCLAKLATAAPEAKSALIRSLLPGIEAALNSGQRLKAIWKALRKEGLQISYRGFHMTVSRARKMRKPTAASDWGKQPKASEALDSRGKVAETVEERDPFANLKLLEEENRPGFHWRGPKSLNALVHGTVDSKNKSNR